MFEQLRELDAAEEERDDEALELGSPFDRYQELFDDWSGRRFHHMVLGHPSPCQDDPIADAAQKKRGLKPPFDAATFADLYADARDGWRLLLQLGSDPRAGFDIMTGGVAYFAISCADLEAGRLEAAVSVLQR